MDYNLEQITSYNSQEILKKINALEVLLLQKDLSISSKAMITDTIKNLREQEAELWSIQSRFERTRNMSTEDFNIFKSGGDKSSDETIRSSLTQLKTQDNYTRNIYENIYTDLEKNVSDFLQDLPENVPDVESVTRVQSAFKTFIVELSDDKISNKDRDVMINEFKKWVESVLVDPSLGDIKNKILTTLETYRSEAGNSSLYKKVKRTANKAGNSIKNGALNMAEGGVKNVLRVLADNPVFNAFGVTGQAYKYIDNLGISRKGSVPKEGVSRIRASMRGVGNAAAPRNEETSTPQTNQNTAPTSILPKMFSTQGAPSNPQDTKILSSILRELQKGNRTQESMFRSTKENLYLSSKERKTIPTEQKKIEKKEEEGSFIETLKNIAMLLAAIPAALGVLGASLGKIPGLGSILKRQPIPTTGGLGAGGKQLPCVPVCKGMGIPDKTDNKNRRDRNRETKPLPNGNVSQNKTPDTDKNKTPDATKKPIPEVDKSKTPDATKKPIPEVDKSKTPDIGKKPSPEVDKSSSSIKGGLLRGGVLGIAGVGATYAGDKLIENGNETTGAVVKTAGTAAEYAGMGAMVGSVVPGAGTLLGGLIGGAIGTGVGLYDNASLLFKGSDNKDIKPNAFGTNNVTRSEIKSASQVSDNGTIEDLLIKQLYHQKIQTKYIRDMYNINVEESEEEQFEGRTPEEEEERLDQAIMNAQALMDPTKEAEKVGFFSSIINMLKGNNASLPSGSGGGSYPVGPADASKGAGSSESAGKAMEFFQKKGWSKEQAAGLVGNLQMESGKGLSTKAVGDGGKAYGIAQWHPDRQQKFAEVMGKDIRSSTLEEQLEFVNWELHNTEKKAGDALRGTTNAKDAAVAVDKKYERSAGYHLGNRVNNAAALLEGDSKKKAELTKAQAEADKFQNTRKLKTNGEAVTPAELKAEAYNNNINAFDEYTMATPEERNKIVSTLGGIPQSDGSIIKSNSSNIVNASTNQNVNTTTATAPSYVNNNISAQPNNGVNPIIGGNLSNVSLSEETIQKLGQIIAMNSKSSTNVVANQTSSGNKTAISPVQSTKSPVNINNVPI